MKELKEIRDDLEDELKAVFGVPAYLENSDGDGPTAQATIDAIEVVRVNPHFNGAGNVSSLDFWVFVIGAYWAPNKAAVYKVVRYERPEPYIVLLKTDNGLTLKVETIDANLQPELMADLDRWNEERPEWWAGALEHNLSEAKRKADEWPL